MAAGAELTPSEYIQHHLTSFTKPIGDGPFWAINVDSLIVSILLGLIGIGFIWWVVRGATSGVPNRRQALVELLIDFVDEQAKGIFTAGDRHRFVAPLALTVFVWVILMNAMDFLPADLVGLGTHHISEHGFRYVPTADVNTTFGLSISVLILTIVFAISAKGFGGWLHELFFAPFGSHPLLIPANFLFQMVEYISKTCLTRCVSSATCTRARSCSSFSGCGPRPASPAPSSARSSASAGRSSTS
jgi:F-type H+-transporting ATPase subunit a